MRYFTIGFVLHFLQKVGGKKLPIDLLRLSCALILYLVHFTPKPLLNEGAQVIHA